MFTLPVKGERRGGRQKGTPNKSTAEIRALAQVHAPAAIKVLVRLMKKAESESTQLEAAKNLLERGYGKPMQPQHHSGSIGTYDASKLADLSDSELKTFESIANRIASTVAASVGDPGGTGEA